MKYKFQYETLDDKKKLIAEHTDMRLIEEHNLLDGNFLIFTDEPELEQPVPMIIMTEQEYLALVNKP